MKRTTEFVPGQTGEGRAPGRELERIVGELVQIRSTRSTSTAETVELLVSQVVAAAQIRSGLSSAGVANALNRMSSRHPGVLAATVDCWKEGVASPPVDLFCIVLRLAGVDVVGRFREMLAILAS